MINGVDILLEVRTQTGSDDFGAPIYTSEWQTVGNVLIYPASGTDITDSINLTGRKAVYTLGIPKGDSHVWENRKVQFFGETWEVIGMPTEGIEDLIPLSWNKKVTVTRYA